MNKLNPVKPFKTLDEEAKFWETHDLSSLIGNSNFPLEKLETIEKEKTEVLTLRIQKSIKEKLKYIARIKGINPTTLARMWLVEKLLQVKLR